MEILEQLIHNRVLLCGGCAWISAQILKTIIHAILNRGLDLKRLLGDGGMPSGHSATVTAVALSTGLTAGFDSPLFAVAAFLAIIVMHDAMGVRRETGKQAKALNDLMAIIYDEGTAPEIKLKEFVGHSPLQVFFGFILGIIVVSLFGLI